MAVQRIPRALTVLVGAAAAIVVLAGIRAISSIVGPVVLALVLVIAVSPVREWLTRRRAPAWVVIAVPLALVIVFLLGMVAVLTVSVAQLAGLIPTYSDQLNRLVADAQRLAARLGYGSAEINRALESLDPGQLLQFAQQFLSGLLGVLSSLFLIVVLLLAMSLDAPVFARTVAALGSDRWSDRSGMIAALASFTYKVRRYLIVSTFFGFICAVLDVGALYLLGVPLPLLWGVLALITNYIPNIGFLIGLVPPALLGLLEGGPRTMILVILAYMAINVVVQSFIQPKFLGDAVGLSTTVTFLSLIVWAFVLGPLGALLAIPLSLLTRALLVDSDPAAAWAGALLSGAPPTTGARPAAPSDATSDAPLDASDTAGTADATSAPGSEGAPDAASGMREGEGADEGRPSGGPAAAPPSSSSSSGPKPMR